MGFGLAFISVGLALFAFFAFVDGEFQIGWVYPQGFPRLSKTISRDEHPRSFAAGIALLSVLSVGFGAASVYLFFKL
jgi:hypothetical protein